MNLENRPIFQFIAFTVYYKSSCLVRGESSAEASQGTWIFRFRTRDLGGERGCHDVIMINIEQI
jgi:hypothetical protein